MQISLDYREQVDSYWAEFLGCPPASLYRDGDTISHHRAAPGVFCLEIGNSRVLSLAGGVHIRPPFGPMSREWIYSVLASKGAVSEVYGPGDLLYCTADTFTPVDETICEPLKHGDQDTLNRFANLAQWRCEFPNQTLSWTHAYGIYQDSRLVSAATTIIWGNTIAAIKVATLTGYRGRGYGRAVTSAVTHSILSETHLIPQYDADTNNHPSQQIARRLGFQHYGRFYYGKLKQQ